LLCQPGKLDRTENVAVVRHSHRVHTQVAGLTEQLVDPDGTVQKAVFRVHVQVGKRTHENLFL
jgi:hypothetical protein